MVKALFIAEGIESHKHSFIISEFSHRFIKLDKIFEQKYDRMLRKVFEYREMCDYKTMFEVDAEMSSYCLEEASEFIEEIERYFAKGLSSTRLSVAPQGRTFLL